MKTDQDPRGLSEGPLGGACVDLDNLLSGDGAGVPDRNRERDRLRRMGGEGLRLHPERCIGEAEAEGIEHFVRAEGLKVAVADIEVLGLDVFSLRAEAVVRWPEVDAFRDGVRQVSGGGYITGKHVQNGVAALLAALPDIEHGGGVKLPDPAHVHDVPGIQENRGSGKVAADKAEHVPLRLGKQEASGFGAVVLVLTGGAADQDQRNVGVLGRAADQVLGKGHLLLKPGLGGPALSGVEGMVLKPSLIGGGERAVQAVAAGPLQRVTDPDDIVGVDGAAGAGAAFIIMELGTAEKREALAVAQRKRLPVIFEKDNAFGGGPARGGGIGGRIPMSRVHNQIPRNG